MKQLNRYEQEWVDSWNSEEALAVYEFCEMLKQNIWRRHGLALCEEYVAELDADADDTEQRFTATEDNLELPFEDDIPF